MLPTAVWPFLNYSAKPHPFPAVLVRSPAEAAGTGIACIHKQGRRQFTNCWECLNVNSEFLNDLLLLIELCIIHKH